MTKPQNTASGRRAWKTYTLSTLGLGALAAVVVTGATPDQAGAQRWERDNGARATFSGTVVRREIGKKGDVKHVWLNTGQKIHIHKGQGWGIRNGQRLSGSGYWETKKYGREIVPTTFNRGS